MKKMRKRVVCEYEHYLDAGCEKVFPLLCPIREYEWLPQWRCDMIYSENGVAELGCVFTTDYGDDFGRETWVVFCYRPGEKIGFVRTGKHRTTRYEIFLQPQGKGSLIRWSQELTALDSRGDELLAEFDQERFKAFMIPINKMLAHYLATGKSVELNLES
jgi:hypothetical protein